jgi:hypothetical protein
VGSRPHLAGPKRFTLSYMTRAMSYQESAFLRTSMRGVGVQTTFPIAISIPRTYSSTGSDNRLPDTTTQSHGGRPSAREISRALSKDYFSITS